MAGRFERSRENFEEIYEMKSIKFFVLTVLFLFCLTNLALAQEVITGGKAKDYVGEFSKKFSAGTYTVQVLSRNLASPSTQGKIDGIVFNAQSGSFRYIRRKDGDHILVLLSYKKTPVVKIEADNAASFEQMVKENKLVPYIVLGDDGAELAIIYAPYDTRITCRQKKDKSVYLEVESRLRRRNIFIREEGQSHK